MPNVVVVGLLLRCYAECRYAYVMCRYAECRYAECRYAECRYAECRYAEGRGAIKILPLLTLASFSNLNVIKLFFFINYAPTD